MYLGAFWGKDGRVAMPPKPRRRTTRRMRLMLSGHGGERGKFKKLAMV